MEVSINFWNKDEYYKTQKLTDPVASSKNALYWRQSIMIRKYLWFPIVNNDDDIAGGHI